MEELKINRSIKIYAPTNRVWEALTKREFTRQYFFGSEINSEFKVGAPIVFKRIDQGKETIDVKGNILSIKPGHLLQFTVWSPESGIPDIPTNYTIVTYNLTEENGSTILNITQDNFRGDEKRYKDSDKGWEIVMKGLKDFLER
jgi:uncharacterized protein YndB with AHSA1/START domain